jgi:hypothetical protein
MAKLDSIDLGRVKGVYLVVTVGEVEAGNIHASIE